MSIKDFLMRKMLASKLKDVPQEQQEKLFSMIEKNPELFQKIALEAQEAMKGGRDQMVVMSEIVKKYESELKGLI